MSLETRFVQVNGIKIRVRAFVPLSLDRSRPVVVFFHGFSFSIDDWDRIGMLSAVRDNGFEVVAIDLPAGKASKSDRVDLKELSECNPIVDQVLFKLGLEDDKFVIVGPSMGGGFALAYAYENPKRVLGLVLISPAIHQVPESSIKSIQSSVKVLLVWGDKDDVFPLNEQGRKLQRLLPGSKLITLKDAGHPAYLDKPEEFREILLNFLREIPS